MASTAVQVELNWLAALAVMAVVGPGQLECLRRVRVWRLTLAGGHSQRRERGLEGLKSGCFRWSSYRDRPVAGHEFLIERNEVLGEPRGAFG
jgi:hypothetical protein